MREVRKTNYRGVLCFGFSCLLELLESPPYVNVDLLALDRSSEPARLPLSRTGMLQRAPLPSTTWMPVSCKR